MPNLFTVDWFKIFNDAIDGLMGACSREQIQTALRLCPYYFYQIVRAYWIAAFVHMLHIYIYMCFYAV